MSKYKAHIITHSHWDREWYLPYEQHHMRLIELIDNILREVDENPDFKSFHLDGQTISINDYLQVRPQNRDRLYKALNEGKIMAGPWFILQDAFLTSSEANVRNMYYGQKDVEDLAVSSRVGYYPDTFGINGQVAQMMKESGIDNVFFGRGVAPTGFNNEVSDGFESKFSEMLLEAPNGDKVLGVLFANWYSNGNDIPTDPSLAKEYWDKRIEDVLKYCSSKHLLFMNGCDHQPYPDFITEQIKLANELYDDIEFVQSTLNDYVAAVLEDVSLDELNVIKGELRSQNTTGHYTLVNCASSRIYEKIANVNTQNMYEMVSEPLQAMVMDDYMHNQLQYGWKTLMENHPHDSICGCSVDSVHKTVDDRFARALDVGEYIRDEALESLSNAIKLESDARSFVVVNTLPVVKKQRHEAVINYTKSTFKEFGLEGSRLNSENQEISDLVVVDHEGKVVNAIITDLGTNFDYDLPKDSFRVSYYARQLKIEFDYDINPYSYETFSIVKSTDAIESSVVTGTNNHMENSNLKVSINEDGSLDIHNRKSGILYPNAFNIFDQGDLGNEYMFGQVQNDKYLFPIKVNNIKSYKDELGQKLFYSLVFDLPKEAGDTFAEEKRKLVEFYKRQTKRSDKTVEMVVNVELELLNNDEKISCSLNFDNVVKDHRMRLLFNMNEVLEDSKADSIFELAKRNAQPSKQWTHTSNDLHLSRFVSIGKENMLTISTLGLHEYEIKNDKLELTILRSTSELGDWGEFPTEDSQCLGESNINFNIYLHTDEEANKVYQQAITDFVQLPYTTIDTTEGTKNTFDTMLEFDKSDNVIITSLKKNSNNEYVIRMYNIDENTGHFKANLDLFRTNFLEVEQDSFDGNIKPFEIVTLILK